MQPRSVGCLSRLLRETTHHTFVWVFFALSEFYAISLCISYQNCDATIHFELPKVVRDADRGVHAVFFSNQFVRSDYEGFPTAECSKAIRVRALQVHLTQNFLQLGGSFLIHLSPSIAEPVISRLMPHHSAPTICEEVPV